MKEIVRLEIYTDYEHATSAGNDGSFQVSSIVAYDENDNEVEFNHGIDAGEFFRTKKEVQEKLLDNGLNENVDIELI